MPRTLWLVFLSCPFIVELPVCPAADVPSAAADVSLQIDQEFARLWKEHGVSPTEPADDATFLRRVSLDLTGTIPDVNQVREFLNDDRPEKRRRLIQKLLGMNQQSAHLARELAQAMLPNREGFVQQLEGWLFERIQAGATWDEIAAAMIAPKGQNAAGENFFVNSLERKPEKIADATARIFLGLQMGCAECHDHPFGQWTREEFWNYSAFFADAAAVRDLEIFGRERVRLQPGGEVSPLVIPDTGKVARPQFPGAKTPLEANGKPNRERLAAWMTAAENPWFARAAVNRVWSMLFGRGLVDPVDDLTAMDSSLTKEVLDLLAEDFTAHGFDLKRLLEIIAGTRVYQLASHLDDKETIRAELFHVMPVRSLTAEQIYGCLIQAVAGRRPSFEASQTAAMERQQFVASLTAPTQSATEFQAGIPQMLTLLNGPFIARVTDVQKCDLLAALKDGPFFTDGDRIEILYLSTLTRKPKPEELLRARTFLKERRRADSQGQELGDLLWVLLNSSEFLLNH